MKNVKLVIFDMDGLMLDSESVYLKNAIETLEEMGFEADRDLIIATMGLRWDITAKMYEERYPVSFEDFQKQLRIHQEAYLKKHPYEKKKGLIDLLDYLKEKGIAMAVATSTHQPSVNKRLKDAQIFDYFDHIVSGDEITEGKPSPQIYRKVLEKTGIDKDNALVFEDSGYGLASAYNAGIRCIIVPDLCVIPEEELSKAFAVLPDLSQGIGLIETLNT